MGPCGSLPALRLSWGFLEAPLDDITSSRIVKQIASFPRTPTALPDDLLLLQRYGLGGPYISLPVATVLATGLTNLSPTAPQTGLGLTYGLPVSWQQNWPLGQDR